MKRCTQTHTVPGFGEIPEGSLWAADSPYVLDDNADKFTEVDVTPPPVVRRKPVRKFGQPAATVEVEVDDGD